ncbi:MAG: HlyD family efflux transporter periplasmic adaptor subunit [Synergistaceae bacterium]|nr:HlyD family efflux transporter periplasmic adaptor subunit [Synergistaceae bacterium]
MKKILFVMILLVAAAGVFFYFERGTGQNPAAFIQRLLESFRSQPPGSEMKLFGNVEMRQVLLGFRVSGRLDEIYFEEGQSVVFGDLLGALDPLPYEIKLAGARAALHQARAALAKMESGHRGGEIRQTAAQRDQIRASLNLAEKDWARLSNLFAQGAVARKDLDDISAARERLRAELSSAEHALSLMREGFRAEDIEAAVAAVELAEAQTREAENSLADTRLYAPSDGTILTRIAEPGTVVATGQPVYSVMLKTPVQVRTYVMGPQLGKIRLGMKGKIFTDSHPDPVEGTVNFIASEAEFTPKQVQTEDQRADLVYRIRLLVEDDGRLKNGMPATVFLDDIH